MFHYRLTPQSTTGQSPFQLPMNRTPRSRLDLTFPDTSARVLNRQGAAVDRRTARASDFCCGDAVWVINFTSTPKWMPGVLEECLGPATFTVRLDDGRIWKRHADHIRRSLPSEGGQMLPESAGISDRSSPSSTSTLAATQPPSHADAESPQPPSRPADRMWNQHHYSLLHLLHLLLNLLLSLLLSLLNLLALICAGLHAQGSPLIV